MSDPIKLDLDAIEAAAKAATPGEWHWVNHVTDQPRQAGEWRASLRTIEKYPTGAGGYLLPKFIVEADEICDENMDGNAAFIATANPTVVLELVRRLRAAEALSAARIVEIPKDIAAVALVGEFKPAFVQEMKAFHDALREQHSSSALVMCVQSPTDLQALDDEKMRLAGWVRA